ncbi:MAG: hypothetical protein ACI90V_003328 [Bacillariaceae sp.]|jgi:hypothetical protein
MATIQQTTRTVFLLYCVIFISTNPSSLFFSVDALSAIKPSSRTAKQHHSSRRDWLNHAGTGVVATVVAGTAFPQASFATTAEYITELESSLTKLQPIPNLLQEEKWDEVRTILKTPPVNKLWNLGESQNPVMKLAKETGNVELFEVKDELAYNLQMTDELTYNNVFVYFQPGNGKIKIKEPQDAVNMALKQLESIIKESS